VWHLLWAAFYVCRGNAMQAQVWHSHASRINVAGSAAVHQRTKDHTPDAATGSAGCG
jgi:hypothetical protein